MKSSIRKIHIYFSLTTKDVVFSHERSMKKFPEYITNMRNFDRLEVIDDYKIRFIFKQPDVMFLPTHMLYIASKTYYDRVGEEEFMKSPVGTGPYKFVEWKPGQYIDLERNEDYWGEKPPVKQARIVFAREEVTRVAMLKAGEVDAITDTPWALVKEVEEAGFNIAKQPGCPALGVQFQNSNPNVPWYDKRVRQAIAYAIDRQAIVKNLFYGIPNIYAWLAPGELGYDPELKPYPYDVTKAKQLLAEAGYPNGFNMPLYYQVGRANDKDLVETVTLYLSAIGIKCDVTGLDTAKMAESRVKWHNNPTAEVVCIGGPCVAHQAEPVRGLQGGYYSAQPQSLYSNPEVDALIDKALITVNDSQRGELIKQAYRIMNDDLPLAMVLANVSVYASKPNIVVTPTQGSSRLVLIRDISAKQ